jgi:hypothetical protein
MFKDEALQRANDKIKGQINDLRRSIPPARFKEFEKATPGGRLRILAEEASNPKVRDHFLEAARRRDELDEMLTREREELERAMEDEQVEQQVYTLEQAFLRGPKWGQRATAKIDSGLKWLLNVLLALLWGLTFPARFFWKRSSGFCLLALVIELIFIVAFNLYYELGINTVMSLIPLAIFFVIAVGGDVLREKGKTTAARSIWSINTVLSLGLFWILAFHACFSPLKGYVGVVTEKDRVVRVIDSTPWLMTPPNILRDQEIIWYDVVSPEFTTDGSTITRRNSSLETLLGEKWLITPEARGMKVVLQVSSRRSLRLEGFKGLPGSGKDSMHYRNDLKKRVHDLLESKVNQMSLAPDELARLSSEINNISNELYSLRDTETTVTFVVR